MTEQTQQPAQKTDILNLTTEELALRLEQMGQKPFRTKQILKWVYPRQTDDFHAMTDLTKDLRSMLADRFTIRRLKVADTARSSDGSVKYLFEFKDKQRIETVLIPEKDHFTLCISTQVGCARGCRFCQTAKGGFIRNLTRGEIISQVRDAARMLEDSAGLTNIVVMGMGEPLDNYDNMISAVSTIMEPDTGLEISSRRVTISTSGVVPRLADLGRDTAANLAVSLNAADDKTRSLLMPVNAKYPISQLIEACKNYPLPPRRRITFEYILIRGINDSEDDARRLSKLLRPVRAKINLIPFNAHSGSEFARPDEAAILRFQNILLDKNHTVIIRRSKGEDIMAACGQLRARAINHPDA